MGLQLKIAACIVDCKSIRITDITGQYNATTNTGGWGGINPPVALGDGGRLQLFLNDQIYYTRVFTPSELAAITTDTYELDLYTPPNLLDGQYKALFTVIAESGNVDGSRIEIKTCVTFNVTCKMQCKIQKVSIEAAKEMCKSDCDKSQKTRTYQEIYSKWLALRYANECDSLLYKKLYDQLNKLLTLNFECCKTCG